MHLQKTHIHTRARMHTTRSMEQKYLQPLHTLHIRYSNWAYIIDTCHPHTRAQVTTRPCANNRSQRSGPRCRGYGCLLQPQRVFGHTSCDYGGCSGVAGDSTDEYKELGHSSMAILDHSSQVNLLHVTNNPPPPPPPPPYTPIPFCAIPKAPPLYILVWCGGGFHPPVHFGWLTRSLPPGAML